MDNTPRSKESQRISSGLTNQIPVYTGSTTVGSGIITDNGTNVGISQTSPSYKLDVNGVVSATSFNAVGSGVGVLKLFDSSGLNWTAIQSLSTESANWTVTLPNSGTSGYTWVDSDGAGTMQELKMQFNGINWGNIPMQVTIREASPPSSFVVEWPNDRGNTVNIDEVKVRSSSSLASMNIYSCTYADTHGNINWPDGCSLITNAAVTNLYTNSLGVNWFAWDSAVDGDINWATVSANGAIGINWTDLIPTDSTTTFNGHF